MEKFKVILSRSWERERLAEEKTTNQNKNLKIPCKPVPSHNDNAPKATLGFFLLWLDKCKH